MTHTMQSRVAKGVTAVNQKLRHVFISEIIITYKNMFVDKKNKI